MIGAVIYYGKNTLVAELPMQLRNRSKLFPCYSGIDSA